MTSSRKKGEADTERRKVTQADFFKICMTLTANKEWFFENRPKIGQATEKLSELVGFEISPSTIKNAKETTGITWTVKNQGGRRDKLSGPSADNIRTLATALRHLYIKLGEEPTAALESLYQRRCSHNGTGVISSVQSQEDPNY